jgi:hypothetical protein
MMSEQTNYCTTKGLGWAFLVIILTLTALPIAVTIMMLGVDSYAGNCEQSILMPCLGLLP